jgi:ribonucleoside-triphosphate reductase
MGYCFAYDLTRLAKEGLFFLKNYNNVPPKHLTTFLDDVIEFVSFMSNRSSGAVGIPNILVWTYYFWRKDVQQGFFTKDPDSYLRQSFQKLIYRLNQPFMRIDQTAFVNVSIFDRQYCESLFGGLEFPDGTLFIDCVEEFIEHQKIFMEVVSQIRSENLFTFPVLTFALQFKDNKFVDEEFARWCSDHNTKWNDSNFFVSENVTTLANCCRLLSNTKGLKNGKNSEETHEKLTGYINSIGGSSLSIGSTKVNTINLVRIAIEAMANKTKNDSKISSINSYLKILRKRTELCCKLLDVQRAIIEKNVERGLLPNYCDGGIDITHQYSTIGIL